MMNKLSIFTGWLLTLTFPLVQAQEHAEMLEYRVEYILEDEKTMTRLETVRLKVINEEGKEKANFYENYDQFSKIKNFTYEIFNKSGKRVEKYRKGDLKDYSLTKSYETNDNRRVFLEPEYGQFPYTVEYTCKKQYDGIFYLSSWFPLSQYNLSVKQASLTIQVAPEISIRYLCQNGLNEPQKGKNEEGYSTYHWAVENLEAKSRPAYQISDSETFAHVKLTPIEFILDGRAGSYETWSQFGQWYDELNTDNSELTSATRQKLDQFKAESSDENELVSRIYRFMQDKTRYVSIQLGIGGWKSLPAAEVDKFGYGDCKALSNYMKRMLKYVGISSNFVVVNAGRKMPPVLKDFPSNQFNHVFLGVPYPNDTLWLECTSSNGDIDYLGDFTDGRNVLWIDGAKSRMIKTPEWSAEENQLFRKMNITVDEKGNGVCNLTVNKTGTWYKHQSYYKMYSENELKNWFYRRFDFSNYEITSFNVEQVNDSLLLKEHFEITLGQVARVTGNRMIIPINFFNDAPRLFSGASEDNAVKLKRAGSFREEISMTFPEGFAVQFMGKNESIETHYGSYTIRLTDDAGSIHISRNLKLNKGTYTGSDFKEFSRFIGKVQELNRQKILLAGGT
jgi:hypothetical protein